LLRCRIPRFNPVKVRSEELRKRFYNGLIVDVPAIGDGVARPGTDAKSVGPKHRPDPDDVGTRSGAIRLPDAK
jgi:hypothetical protein